MTDKTSMELEAEASGVLLKILRHDGETVPVTEVISYIGQEGEEIVTSDQGGRETGSGGRDHRRIADRRGFLPT